MPIPSPTRKKLGTAVINAMPPDTTVWDTDLKGFCARRQKSTAVTYQLKLRVGGTIRWLTIGRHGQPWTSDTARKRALDLLNDPSLADKPTAEDTLTLATVSAQFFISHGPKLRPRTLEEYRRLERLYLLPAFGKLAIATITRAIVSTKHASWSTNPRAANHALAVLSKIFSWAEDQGYRPEGTNPCRRIQRYKENKRETFLQSDDLARLGAALDQAAKDNLVGPFALAALRLLILTGARLNEILKLEWAQVDVDRRILFLEDTKTGKKPLHLNDAAIAILADLPRFANNPYVIAGNRHGQHLVNLQKPWQTVRALAKLPHVRIHDLRHTFASYAMASGGSLLCIGTIGGPAIGARNAHRSQPAHASECVEIASNPITQPGCRGGSKLDAVLECTPGGGQVRG